jgi:LDH2 family malate/lactate/ureidoglycolate dehydrogenase
MADEAGGTLYPVEQRRAFTLRAFETVGVPDEDAAIVTDNLIEANLRGVDTHGITRLLAIYVKRLKVGIVNPTPQIEVVGNAPSAIVVDGDNGLGAVVGAFAMREAIAIRQGDEDGAAVHVVEFEVAGGLVTAIRDFYHVPYLLQELVLSEDESHEEAEW